MREFLLKSGMVLGRLKNILDVYVLMCFGVVLDILFFSLYLICVFVWFCGYWIGGVCYRL